MCKIEFRNVRLAFGERVILDDLNLCVASGELKVILGQSGSGKSTILRLALGLLKPAAGEIYIDDIEITQLREAELMPIRQKISMVFQGGALFDSLTVYENIAYRPRELGWTEEEIERRVRRVLELVELPDFADTLPATLSGGQKRLVAVARAMVDKPEIIFFDEPTAGLDPITAQRLCQSAIRLRDLEGVTILFVTHKLDNARYISSNYMVEGVPSHASLRPEADVLCLTNTKFVVLKDGGIAFEGTDEQLWQSPDPFLRAFTAMTGPAEGSLSLT